MISKKHKTSRKKHKRSRQNHKIPRISTTQKIDYNDIGFLRLFLTEQGKIFPRRTTRLTVQQQRNLAKAIKRARILFLFSFITSNSV